MIAKPDYDTNHPCPDGCASSNISPLFPNGEITQFQGKTKLFTIETHRTTNGSSFMDLPDYADLLDAITELYRNVHPRRNRIASIARIRAKLSNPRNMVKLVRYEEDLVGEGIFNRRPIQTRSFTAGVTGGYVMDSHRAIQEGYRGEGVGTHMLVESIKANLEECAKGHRPLLYLILEVQNGLSAFTVMKLKDEKIGLIDETYPFDIPYYIDENEPSFDIARDGWKIPRANAAQDAMSGYYRDALLRGEIQSSNFDPLTGVIRGELVELGMNEAFRSDNDSVMDLHRKIIKRVNRENGDVLLMAARLKRPGSGSHLALL